MDSSEKRDYKKARRFLRVVGYVIITFYTIYFGYSKVTIGSANLDNTDWGLIGLAVSLLIAIESVRAYVKRRWESKK